MRGPDERGDAGGTGGADGTDDAGSADDAVGDATDPDDVAVLLYEGFDELDAVGPYEVFRTAGLPARYVALEARDRVTAAHGTRVEPDGVLASGDAPDVVLVPGGGWNDRRDAGAWAEAERGVVPDRLGALHDAGVRLAAVCTGGMLLARAGLLDGRPATTHHGALDDLRATGANVVDARVVDDGDVLTAGGVTSGLDLALHLVERWRGADAADAVAATLAYERRGPVWTP